MGYISVGTEKLHYLEWGTGKRLLLAFHGYGNDAEIFSLFAAHLGSEYTILSFDLPHHGRSEWSNDTMLTKKDLVTLIGSLKVAYHVDKVSLLGYSMGGRVCLTVIEVFPECVDKAVLIASDGLEINGYYYFFTQTYLGSKIFRYMLKKPALVLKLTDWLNSKKIVDPSRHKFVTHYLKPEASRQFLLKVWPGMRDLVPTPSKVRQAIRKHHIPVSIFMGNYDRIMPPALAEKFKSGLDTVHLFILERGHKVFDEENAHQIAQRLL